MTKRKIGPMRPKTKEAMVRLAEIMVAKHKLEVIKGTPEFLEYAIHEAEENELGISWQTIKLREQFLEMRCDELYKTSKVVTKELEYDQYEDEADIVLYDESGFEVDDSIIISVAIAKIQKMMVNKVVNQIMPTLPTKEYNMFYEGEDGLTWLKGNFKNQAVGTPGMRYVNRAGIVVTERTHAKYMLSQVPNSYTEDDVDVLTKIATGTYE